MLLRFGVSNYKSLKDYQELSLVASSLKDEPAYLLDVSGSKEHALPVVGIYGANASGKSNVLGAFEYFRSFILNSHSKHDAEDRISRKPFRLDPASKHEPSRFDCDIILDGVRYQLGFALDRDKILEEWLYAYPSGSRQVWYHRKYEENPEFQFGKFLKGKNKTIEALTRDNSLFLSAAAQNNHALLRPIVRYFRNRYSFRSISDLVSEVVPKYFTESDTNKNRIVDFLRQADIGIADLRVKEKNLPDSDKRLRDDLNAVIKKHVDDPRISKMLDERIPRELTLAHCGPNGRATYLKLKSESSGTRALLSILEPIFRALEEGRTLFIDELNTSIHTLLAIRILQLFVSPETNPKGAQLIFTTHDTNLLCANVLRRDEIWFTEKNNEGATHLYPLTDIKTRKTDNLEKGYLQGRFGGIPFLGKLEDLFKVQRGA